MTKISLNAPCPCGSGRKYKRCCLPKQKGAKPKAAARSVPVEIMGQRWILEEDELDALSNSAVDLIAEGRLDEAENVGRQLRQRYPDVPDGLERLGAVCEARGQFAQAARYYSDAAKMIHGDIGFDPEIEKFYLEKAKSLENLAKV
jgi:DNA-binding SARP family transcriptional activator